MRFVPPLQFSMRRLARGRPPSGPDRSRLRSILHFVALVSSSLLIFWITIPYACPLPPQLASPLPGSPRILDRHGQVLDEFPRDDLFRHHPVHLARIPASLRDATLVAEDKRFYQHDGVDYAATLRAARDNLHARRIISGASTITQQLIKISSPPSDRSLPTKIREALTARHLEYRWTKDEILAAYLNRLDYGHHRQGCQEAAQFYFGKPVSDLSLAEAALLAALPQSPSLHDPFRNQASALKRRNWILDRLASELSYDQLLVSAAKSEPIRLHRGAPASDIPHLASRLQGTSSPLPSILTTIDRDLQRQVSRIVTEELALLRHANVRHAAVVVIENESGEVLALVGSRDFHDPLGGQINGARIPRSAGSTLKPFTYLLAFERRGLSPGSIIADVPTPYRTEEGLDLPRNYDHRHHGPVTIRHALANSLNVAAMRTLNDLGGPEPLHALLRDLGLTLDRSAAAYGLGLTIGNAEVSLLELTNAYATLARLGIFRPTTILRPVEPASSPPQAPSFPVASSQAAFLIADVLSDNTARSHAFGFRSPLHLPFKTAVKTGTSSDFRDNWCIGFTADLTVGVWVGNFDNSPMRGISGVSGAGPVFHRTMLALHGKRAPRWITPPADLTEITIDTRTGHHFPSGSPPTRPFAARDLCQSSRVPPPVRPSDYDSLGRALIDQTYQEWFLSADNTRADDFALVEQRPVDLAPKIISPMPTATYLLDPELPSGGRLLKLLSNLPSGARWSSPTLRIEGDVAHLQPGKHRIVLVDTHTGCTLEQEITVQSL